jgi:hypothetical protein
LTDRNHASDRVPSSSVSSDLRILLLPLLAQRSASPRTTSERNLEEWGAELPCAEPTKIGRGAGGRERIVVGATLHPEGDVAPIRSLIPIFQDHRYIRVTDRPIFLVYKASGMPEPAQTLERWKTEAKHAGLKGLFVVRVESYTDLSGDPRTMGFDAALEFQTRAALLWKRIFRRKWWQTISYWNLLRGNTAYCTGRRGCSP